MRNTSTQCNATRGPWWNIQLPDSLTPSLCILCSLLCGVTMFITLKIEGQVWQSDSWSGQNWLLKITFYPFGILRIQWADRPWAAHQDDRYQVRGKHPEDILSQSTFQFVEIQSFFLCTLAQCKFNLSWYSSRSRYAKCWLMDAVRNVGQNVGVGVDEVCIFRMNLFLWS